MARGLIHIPPEGGIFLPSAFGNGLSTLLAEPTTDTNPEYKPSPENGTP